MAKDDIFDRLHFRTVFDNISSISPPTPDDYTGPAGANFPAVEIKIYYPAYKDFTRTTIIWKPLKYVDGTSFDKRRGTSLYKSGIISWDLPEDWIKTKHYYNGSPTLADPTVDYTMGGSNFANDSSGTSGIDDVWNIDSYALIIAFTSDRTGVSSGNYDKFKIHRVLPFSNAHSQAVKVIDPTCLSLNIFGIAQSISFNRKGKFQTIESRLGTAEIRKIGVEGGMITFGGVDLASDTMRKTMYEYQRDAVLVYVDVTHNNGDFTRFFGTITNMSEDHATAKMHPKFAVTLSISKIGMFGSDGKILSEGLVSLGGELGERPDYISFGGHKK